MITLWAKGVIAHRSGRLLLAAAGVTVATALIGFIGLFALSSAETMTRRALAEVPVDWQIAVKPNTDPISLSAALKDSVPVVAAQIVGYGNVAGFEATTGGTTQTTGAGKVLGIRSDYPTTFPGQARVLAGSREGVLIAQQTAANLHVGVGDTVRMLRPDNTAAEVQVDGVIDLSSADAMFQTIGTVKGQRPTAPPDNVLLLPIDRWTRLFTPGPQDGVVYQIHAKLDRAHLSANPVQAFVEATGQAHKFEARTVGTSVVGNNLAARLDAVRSDALYARILLLFLGLPGAVLAGLITIAIVAAGTDRRRRDQALLRTRGAATGQILRTAAVEALFIAVVSSLCGALLATLLSALLGLEVFTTAALLWLAATVATGGIFALAAVLAPAWIDLRHRTVVISRTALTPKSTPLWKRTWLDLLLLALSAIVFWGTASAGYQVVLAPEGVPGTSVDYPAFLAPLLLWIGTGLLVLRLCGAGIERGRRALSRMTRPLSRRLSDLVAASLSRQHARVARGIALSALAFSFATATAIFNTTYNAQLYVDAQLTNGADVTVTGTATIPASDQLAKIAAVRGVAAAEPMQHRFAYVGNDLQDLYGIDPVRIGNASKIVDAYFANQNARATLDTLQNTLDGVLVSQETVNDFQLAPGDLISLRLQSTTDNQYHAVPFHFIGVVTEFPTAPRDSFLLANARYVAQQTGSARAEIVLVKAVGDPGQVASTVAEALGPGSALKVTDIGQAARLIGSSLTAVDLHALTSVELSVAVALIVGATGLVLALGFAERRRTFGILRALGAPRSVVGAFLWTEALLLLAGGAIFGTMIGVAVARMLVTLLTGVFDPPPSAMSVPWGYLTALATAATIATIAAVFWARNRPHINQRLGSDLLS